MKDPHPETVSAWVQLNRLQTRLLGQINSALNSRNLPALSWYDVLWELHRADSRGLRQFEVAERTLLPKYNLSRLLDRLESEQLVRRRPCPEDGRGQQIFLTSEGQSLLKQMWPVYGEVLRDEFECDLTRQQMKTLNRLLARVLTEDQD